MRAFKIIAILLSLLILLAALPRLLISEPEIGMTTAEKRCAQIEVGLFFDNPLEKLLIQRIVFTAPQANGYAMKAYTLGGLTYATGIVSFAAPITNHNTSACNTHFKLISRISI